MPKIEGTMITGASDDLIEIEGELCEEFNSIDCKDGVMALSDGTLLKVDYDEDGIWRFKARFKGTLYDRKIDGWDYPVVEIDGVSVIDANYMFSNTMMFVPLNKHKKYLTREVDFRATKDGQIWAPVSGYDFQEAYLIGKMQMGSENLQQGGMLGDLKGQYDA